MNNSLRVIIKRGMLVIFFISFAACSDLENQDESYFISKSETDHLSSNSIDLTRVPIQLERSPSNFQVSMTHIPGTNISLKVDSKSTIDQTTSDPANTQTSEEKTSPGNIEKIDVTILKIHITTENGGLIVIKSEPYQLDLMELKPDRPIELVNTFVPDGRYCQIRFLFPEDMAIQVDGQQKELKTPSAITSGYKLDYPGCFELKSGQFFSITLDFDPNESVVYNPGPDRYVLKPVLKIERVDTAFIETYNMQAQFEGEAYIVQLATNGPIRFITSENPMYIFNGRFFYNYINQTAEIRYETVDIIDPICLECGVQGTIPADQFVIDDKYKLFKILGYEENTYLQVQSVTTGNILDFYSRETFGPFDE